MIHTPPYGFTCRFRMDGGRLLQVSIPEAAAQALLSTGAIVIAELKLSSDSAQLSLSLNGQDMGRDTAEVDVQPTEITLQTFGANLEGTNGCAAAVAELVLIERALTGAERAELARYLRLALRTLPPT